MIKLWIDKNNIPADEQSKDSNACQEALLPNKCKDCGNIFNISDVGGPGFHSSIHGICMHYNVWEKVWANRIQETDVVPPVIAHDVSFKVIKSRVSNIDPKNDGMKCSGTCGNWTPMAAANQDNGSFICYGCRSMI